MGSLFEKQAVTSEDAEYTLSTWTRKSMVPVVLPLAEGVVEVALETRCSLQDE